MARQARDRERLVAEYERSELSQEAFAKQHGVPVSTLRSWIYRRRRDAPTAQPTPPRLVPVHVVASPAPEERAERGHLEVTLASGLTLRFSIGTDAHYVAELVAALG